MALLGGPRSFGRVAVSLLAPLALSFALLAPLPGAAQALAPDAGSLLRNIEQAPAPPLRPQPLLEPQRPIPAPVAGELQVRVKSFRIVGATRIAAEKLQERLAAFVGRSLSLAGLEAAVEVVVAAYREQGYVVRAYLPPQTIKDGVVEIVVLEGKLGRILIDGGETARLSGERADGYVRAGLTPGEAIQVEKLERSLLLLRDQQGTAVQTTLDAGEREGEIDVHLILTDTPLLSGALAANNTGAVSTGVAQVDVQLNVNGASGHGEQMSLRALAAQGLEYGRVGVVVPVGYDGWNVGANMASMRYHLGDRFASLEAKGRAETVGVNAAYPVVRSRARNVYLSASAEGKYYVDDRLGKPVSQKRIALLSVGVAGSSFDNSGSTSYGATLTGGRLDLSAQAQNLAADAAAARTQGGYTKLGFNAARLQDLGATIALHAALSGQAAQKNLDSSEKFYLGGAMGVRAYPGNEGGGDQGLLLNVELRALLSQEVQAIVFVDAGSVWQNRNLWPGWQGRARAPNRIDLAGAGVGVNLNVWASTLRLSLAWRLGNNPLAGVDGSDSDGSRRIPRFFAQYSKYL